MASAQFQIVPCSSFFFSSSIGPILCLVDVTSSAVPSCLFILDFSVCKSLQCLISTLTQGCECGHSFVLTCLVVLWWGRNTTNKYHWHVWGVLAVYGPHWFSPAHGTCVFLVYTAQVQVALQGIFPKETLGFVHLPGLSCSGSGSSVLHKGTDSVRPVFFALPTSEQLSWPGALWVHCPRWAVHLNHLPGPRCSVSWVCCDSAISGVLCVSSGELISGSNPPGRCQPSKIPGRLG